MIILTEKPSVAKDIANGLGNFSYTKKGFWLSPQNDCIVSAAGHLLELCQPEDYDEKYAKWKIEDLPILPDKMRYIPKKETSSLLKKIKECFDTYDSSNFILATDQDREGELIGALILNYIHFNHYETARRFWVSEALTPDVVKNGIQNAKPLTDYDSLKNAGYARNKADWIIGMNVSRLLTVSVKKLLTFGRVQTAILGAIYLRERNIKNFQPVPYFQMNAIVKNKDGSTFNMLLQNRDSDRFSSRSDSLLEAAEQFVAQKKSLEITKVNSNKKIEYPPQLFNMTGLQK
ncbi:MAG: DNA topoisomerase, partial [Prevotella sp.]